VWVRPLYKLAGSYCWLAVRDARFGDRSRAILVVVCSFGSNATFLTRRKPASGRQRCAFWCGCCWRVRILAKTAEYVTSRCSFFLFSFLARRHSREPKGGSFDDDESKNKKKYSRSQRAGSPACKKGSKATHNHNASRATAMATAATAILTAAASAAARRRSSYGSLGGRRRRSGLVFFAGPSEARTAAGEAAEASRRRRNSSTSFSQDGTGSGNDAGGMMDANNGDADTPSSQSQQQPSSCSFPTAVQPLHVLGAGSMGLLWSYSIRQQYPSYPVRLLLTERHESKLHRRRGDGNTYVSVGLEEAFVDNNDEADDADGKGKPQQRLRQRRRRARGPIEIPAGLVTEYYAREEQDDEATSDDETGQKKQGLHRRKRHVISNLLVTTKAYQAVEAIRSVRSSFACYLNEDDENDQGRDRVPAPTTRIILLCNGALAVRDELERELLFARDEQQMNRRPIVIHLGWTTHGAYRTDNDDNVQDDGEDDYWFHVVHAGFGRTCIENSCPESLTRLFLNCQTASPTEIHRQLWTKLAANCVINPISAIRRCKNGELLSLVTSSNNKNNGSEQPWSSSFVEHVIREVVLVAQAEEEQRRRRLDQSSDSTPTGLSSSSSSPSPPPPPLSVEEVTAFCRQVMVDTAENQSSMLQDVLGGRRTEIEYLNGYVVRLGTEQHGIPCPANQQLCERIRDITSNDT